jgi:hypothetical protein
VSNRATLGWIFTGAGVATAGVGSFFGVQALSKRHDSDAYCPTDTTCTARGVTLNDQAKTDAWVANIGVGVGLVGIAVGSYLLLTGDDSPRPRSSGKPGDRFSVGTNVTRTGAELDVGGKW